MTDSKAHLKAIIRIKTAQCNRLQSIVRSLQKTISETVKEIGVSEYGNIGDTINFKTPAGTVVKGRITMFQASVWDDVPICLLDAEICGSIVSTHLTSGKEIIRD